MVFTRLYLLPGLVVIVLLGTFCITYIIAVHMKHVRPVFPYISDTGTTPPESTIFGQFINLGSVFIFLTMYVRYLYLKRTYLSDSNLPNYENVKRLNRISMWLAVLIPLGTSMAANFQETVALVPHMIGAFGCFIGATVYFTLQSVISYLVCPHLNTLKMARFRLFLSVISAFSVSLCGLFGITAYFMFKKSIKDIPMWAPGEGGYELHIVSSVSEWISTIIFGVYFVTFVREFRNIVVTSPQVEPINQTGWRPNSCSISTVDRTNKKAGEDNNRNITATSEETDSRQAVYPS